MIIIYSTLICPRCKLLKSALKKANIPYEERPLDGSAMTDCACDTGISVREAPLVYADRWIFAKDLFEGDNLKSGWREILNA
jgi:glutaredoxin